MRQVNSIFHVVTMDIFHVIAGLTLLAAVILLVTFLTKVYLKEAAEAEAVQLAEDSRIQRNGIERELRKLELEARQRRLSRDENARYASLIKQRNAMA